MLNALPKNITADVLFPALLHTLEDVRSKVVLGSLEYVLYLLPAYNRYVIETNHYKFILKHIIRLVTEQKKNAKIKEVKQPYLYP